MCVCSSSPFPSQIPPFFSLLPLTFLYCTGSSSYFHPSIHLFIFIFFASALFNFPLTSSTSFTLQHTYTYTYVNTCANVACVLLLLLLLLFRQCVPQLLCHTGSDIKFVQTFGQGKIVDTEVEKR
ncbi:uncharacterized protein TEOVI_000008500 [Trypanosoma equiperdum]|uniref:Uncharacterized protein n=1 Tax=Trypanosoma equiperdum TaxID=5694 RepID=A0A1G4HYM3_TRYEQ|nr:hypothetical protein, conserved [Trypanosoma equiperdum]